jgi:hypothetical protein
MKPEVIHCNKSMWGMDRADKMVPHYTCCRKPVKRTKGFTLFLLQMAALNSFILFKKHTADQNRKVQYYVLKNFTLNSMQKLTDPAGWADGNGESAAAAWTAPKTADGGSSYQSTRWTWNS